MGGNAIVVFWGLASLSAMLLAGLLAMLKNRDYSFWMAWSFLLPPAVIILALMPKVTGATRPRRPTLDEEDRQSDHA